jgi:hypothetical protein
MAVMLLLTILQGWGFFGHERINRLAVFTLPPDMILFYKKNIREIEERSVNPDRRRYAVPEEAPRHYIDLDDYGDSVVPRYWTEAVEKMGEDSLMAHGVVPWHITRMYYRLRDAFMVGDPAAIITVSSELGHYVADAHVPLHTTSNYNGQKTGQSGIHGLWESRLPELFFDDYDLLTGQAQYIDNIQAEAWRIVLTAHLSVDSVLSLERELTEEYSDHKYSFETKSRTTVKVYAYGYSKAYHERLRGMVERQMRASIRTAGSMWYTAWVDAGQPDLVKLAKYQPSERELQARREELARWKEGQLKVRPHD